jgi:hypothetical protein
LTAGPRARGKTIFFSSPIQTLDELDVLMKSHHIFHWLFALFFVCASITQSKARVETIEQESDRTH